ncbi:MAG TPA: hypothetical protein VM076_18105 [Gemmatimonadaceae bacterium]|nr:hypothetical protein [Gemmatimonadaceae bacterium]
MPRDSEGNAVAVVLARRIDNLTYREHFRIEGAINAPELPPGPLEWLDWDPKSRLIALSGGRVWAASVVERYVARFAELLDLRDDRPEERESPDSARRW